MESTEKPEQPRGGIHNYFQGATIHNMVINGNMNKNACESYNSTEEHKRLTPEQVVQTLKQCPEFLKRMPAIASPSAFAVICITWAIMLRSLRRC